MRSIRRTRISTSLLKRRKSTRIREQCSRMRSMTSKARLMRPSMSLRIISIILRGYSALEGLPVISSNQSEIFLMELLAIHLRTVTLLINLACSLQQSLRSQTPRWRRTQPSLSTLRQRAASSNTTATNLRAQCVLKRCTLWLRWFTRRSSS